MNFKEEHIIKEKNINKLDIKDNLNKNIIVSKNSSNTIEHYFFPFNENHKINKELNFKRVFFPNKTEINNEFNAEKNIISHNITKIIKENELKPNYIKNYQNGENECLYFKINNNINDDKNSIYHSNYENNIEEFKKVRYKINVSPRIIINKTNFNKNINIINYKKNIKYDIRTLKTDKKIGPISQNRDLNYKSPIDILRKNLI